MNIYLLVPKALLSSLPCQWFVLQFQQNKTTTTTTFSSAIFYIMVSLIVVVAAVSNLISLRNDGAASSNYVRDIYYVRTQHTVEDRGYCLSPLQQWDLYICYRRGQSHYATQATHDDDCWYALWIYLLNNMCPQSVSYNAAPIRVETKKAKIISDFMTWV